MRTLLDLDKSTWADLRASMLEEYRRDPSCMDPGDIPAADSYDPVSTVDMHEDGYTFSIVDDNGNTVPITASSARVLGALGMARHVLVTPRG